MRKYKITVVITICLSVVLLPVVAYANAGTALFRTTLLYLFIGNAIIGIIEGLLIAKIYHLEKIRSVPVMIVANYFSFIAGYCLIYLSGLTLYLSGNPASRFLSIPVNIYNVLDIVIFLSVIMFLITVIIEARFCYMLFRKSDHAVRKSLTASFIAQTVSYSILFVLFYCSSHISLISQTEVVRSETDGSQGTALIFFISPEDGDVYSIQSDGSNLKKLIEHDIKESESMLFVRCEQGQENRELWVNDVYPNKHNETLLLRNFQYETSCLEQDETSVRKFSSEGEALYLEKSDYKVETGYWPSQGLSVESDDGPVLRLALETPFIQWPARNATVISGDRVIFQMGDQILILDMNKKTLRLITMGRGPLVAIPST